MKAVISACLLLAFSVVLADPPVPTSEQIGQAVYEAYQLGRHAAVLELQDNCWSQPKARSEVGAGVCMRMNLAGVMLDRPLARREGRGTMPGFSIEDQQRKIDAGLRKAGFSESAAKNLSVRMLNGDTVESILAGLLQAGLR